MRYLLLIGALLYLLFPRDLIPDYFVGWGWIDDLVVLYLAWRYFRRHAPGRQPRNHTDQSWDDADDQGFRTADTNRRDHQDPYSVLGVSPGASKEEIKAAYRRQAAKYHPDKVQHLGKEFQKLAEERFKDIQQAHDQLISR
jgi:DnaJ domain/Protein of unknown function (DUF1232)